MKRQKKMTYKALEREVIANRREMRRTDIKHWRTLIRRNHDLMIEMDARWNRAEAKRLNERTR